MRISLIGWRRSTLSIVTVVACASGLQITGCVRSSSRDTGADLSRRAADAAFKAERDIANQASRQPLFSPKGVAKTSLAENPIDRSTNSRNGSYDNPLAELLAARSDKYPSGDPFINAEPSVATFEGIITKDDGTQKNTNDKIRLTQHESGSSVSGDGSAIAKPISARDFPKSEEPENHDIGRVFLNDDWASQQKHPDVEQSRNEYVATENIESQIATEKFSESELGFWKSASDSQKPESTSVNEVSPNSRLSPDENWDQQSVHQQHVKALIKQSEGQHSKGELHAAYRSALLANTLVEQYQLNLAEGDLNPSIIAKEISAQIWGSTRQNQSEGQEPVAVENKDASKLPIIRPRQVRSAQHDHVFQTSESFLNWQASVKTPLKENSAAEKGSLETPSPFDKSRKTLGDSDVKSALFASSTHSYSRDDSFSHYDDPIRQTANVELKAEEENQWITTDLDLLAENKLAAPERFNSQRVKEPVGSQPMPSPVAVERPWEFQQADKVVSDRGPLFAPTHEINPFEANLETISGSRPSEQIEVSETAEVAVTDAQPQGRLKWGVLAFILATLSTLIGLKLNKAPEAKSQPKDESSDKDSDQHLKLSNAA
jgi:hypothetical protein